MFPGFVLERDRVGDVDLRVRYGGSGPPVLLLHGHPRTHTTWHRVAPILARRHTVVCPDLRGYGDSSKPPHAPGHLQASKRAMAHDAIGLMRNLGHDRFASGHHMAEEIPRELATRISDFVSGSRRESPGST